MPKPILDMYGSELAVGDLIMYPIKGSDNSRSDMTFAHIRAFPGYGLVELDEQSWRPVSIRPSSTPVRKVSGEFVEAWKSGELFKML